MSEEMKVPISIATETTVNIKLTIKERTYIFAIPGGVPFEEAYVVGLEMANTVKKMQEDALTRSTQGAPQPETEKESENGQQ